MTYPQWTALLSLLTAVLAALLVMIPLGGVGEDLVRFASGGGAGGVLVFCLAYIAATLVFIPGSLLVMMAGLVYGPLWGALIALPCAVVSAGIAFGLGRTIARDWVAHKVAGDVRFEAIDRAIRHHAFKVLVLLRLSPASPFNVLNYAFGASSVSARDFLLSCLVGSLPSTALYVYLGSLAPSVRALAVGRHAAAWQQALYWSGFACTVLLAWWLARVARRALRESLEAP
jgi:uncharacterized membrane protein YdjX (TVP38/TMEM64 family)